ncbi:MAG: hypothetical protein J6T26_04950, partial [Firmicutes bacterium]|nr:hypothetical protein [Bacillota bacterium]
MNQTDEMTDPFIDSEALRKLTETLNRFKDLVARPPDSAFESLKQSISAFGKLDLPTAQGLKSFSIEIPKAFTIPKTEFARLTEAIKQSAVEQQEFAHRLNEAANQLYESLKTAAWRNVVDSLEAARPYMAEDLAEELD